MAYKKIHFKDIYRATFKSFQMVKYRKEITLLNLTIDRSSDTPLNLQIYKSVRRDILNGILKPGQRLPSTRNLSDDLKVSRNVIALAFEQLIAEGFLNGLTGSGTFVSDAIKIKDNTSSRAQKAIISEKSDSFGLSEEVKKRNTIAEPVIPFQTAVSCTRNFPFHIWSKLSAEVYRNIHELNLGYEDCAGYLKLREAITDYLRISRGVICTTDQVIIVNGSQQGLSLTCSLLLKGGYKACIEDPGYTGTRSAILNAGGVLCPVPVRETGFDVSYARHNYPDCRLVYVTPSHQYPTGVTMALPERLRLLHWAQEKGIYILEDDYDSEFRYSGNPLSSLQGLDSGNRVIYLGTFSKTLFPGLRLGYLVVPPQLITAFRMQKAVTDRQSPVIEQAVLSDFITLGHFARHVKKMKGIYKSRQDVFLEEAERISHLISMQPAETGMHLVGWLADGLSEKNIVQTLMKNGIIAHAVSDYTIKHQVRPGLLFGYTGFDDKEIKKAFRKLEKALILRNRQS
jgi:GntR family transcriptional regulator/MocR family aminotransferase